MQTNPPSSENAVPAVKMLTGPKGRRLAYDYQSGSSAMPAVIYLHGYASDMQATKAQFLKTACSARNQSYLRFDYSGNGQSDGDFAHGTLGDWMADALAVIDGITQENFVMVGSSMGGWIGLHCARQRPDRIRAFIGIAAAPDFTEDIWLHQMSEDDRQLCRERGYYLGEDGLKLYDGFVQEGRNHLLLGDQIRLDIPVILLQGRLDASVPWQTAFTLQQKITPSKAEVMIIEDGDHRLARPQDLEILDDVVRKLAGAV